jgi:hypothetical protein
MHTQETLERLSIERLSKGAFVGYMVFGKNLDLWFSSPTGDSSDSQILTLTCLSSEQAHEIGRMHMRVWGLTEF